MTRVACVVLLLLPGVVAAQDRPDELVKAAIKAAGGSEVLAKFPAGRVVGKCTLTFGNAETPASFEQAFHAPGRLRTVVRGEPKGQKWELLQVVNENTAKQTINGQPVPLTDAGMKELQLAVLMNEVAQLTPLLTDRKFILKPDKQLKGPDAAGVLVQVKGFPELRLAFDTKTGHLVRIAHKAPDPESGKEAETETTFADFQQVSGLMRPTRSVVSRDGKKVVELTVEKFTPLEKLDPRAFTLEE